MEKPLIVHLQAHDTYTESLTTVDLNAMASLLLPIQSCCDNSCTAECEMHTECSCAKPFDIWVCAQAESPETCILGFLDLLHTLKHTQ